MSHRELTYAQAIREATAQEMARDDSVIVLGLGIDDAKGIHGTTKDLHVEFGPERSFDTPLSEDAMTGVAIGAAMAGLRPIHVHERVDFLMLCMNQLVNVAAKASYMWGGSVRVPLVVRAAVGRSWGQGPQHSQALHAMLSHVPGLKVAVPSTAHDMKGCLIAAIRDDAPVVLIEHRMLYHIPGQVPEEPYETPFGRARRFFEGSDLTIVALGHMVLKALRARALLADTGVEASVIDPVTVKPLDVEAIVASVAEAGRLLVVDNAWTFCGASAEILASVAERLPGRALQMERLGFAPVPCPTSRPLERRFYPSAASIASAALRMVTGATRDWPEAVEPREVAAFKGPF